MAGHHRQVSPAQPLARGITRHRLTAALVRIGGRLDTLLAIQARLGPDCRARIARAHTRRPTAPARLPPRDSRLRQAAALEHRFR